MLLSGYYALGEKVSIWRAYYGDDVSLYEERSALPGLLLSDTPLLVVDAELDLDWALEHAKLLADERAVAGKPVRRLHLAGHSHISEGYSVGTSDRSLSDPVLRFIDDVRAGAPMPVR